VERTGWAKPRSGERIFPEAAPKGHSVVFDEQIAEEAT
jgi:hypothetical protein